MPRIRRDWLIAGRESLLPTFIEVDYKPDRIETGYEHPQLRGRQSFLAPGISYGIVKNSGWEYEKEWRTWRSIKGEPQDPVTRLYYFPFDGDMTLREDIDWASVRRRQHKAQD